MGSNNDFKLIRFSRRKLLKGSVAAASVVSPIFSSACEQVGSLFASGSSKHESITLPSWQPAGGVRKQSFRFASPPRKFKVYGRLFSRAYFKEFLPALFERTLVFDRFHLDDGRLEWIFTGERGGFTVQIEPDRVRVYQRYYDSLGLEMPDVKLSGGHPPERTWLDSVVYYHGELRAVQVVLDHRLGLSISLNGKQVIQQLCLLDVKHHQIAYDGTKTPNVEGHLFVPDTKSVDVDVDASQRHQTILGFGGITTPTAYVMLSPEGKSEWWKLLSAYNLTIHREFPMGRRLARSMDNWSALQDASAHYYGDNFPNGEVSDFKYLKTIRQLDGRVLFEFWQLPPWATKERPWRDVWGRPHRSVADPDAYAHAVIDYCKVSLNRVGRPPDIVGIQNERFQPPDVWKQMTLRLRQELDRAGFRAVKIHMQDAPRVKEGIQSARLFKLSSREWSDIDYSAVHMYDYQDYFRNPDGFDDLLIEWHKATSNKPFLSTELCVNSPRYQGDSYRLALQMGQLYHKNLTLANACALCYCWLLLNVEQPSYGWTRSLFVPDAARGFVPRASSYQLRVFGSYSRRIPRGMTRVAAKSSDSDLLTVAFAGDQGERTLVLLNRSVRRNRIRIHWQGVGFRYLEVTDPYHQNAVQAVSELHSDERAGVLVEPGAIVTLSTVPLHKLPSGVLFPS